MSLQGSVTSDPFYEEQEAADQHKKLTGMVHATGACSLRSYRQILINLRPLFYRVCYRH